MTRNHTLRETIPVPDTIAGRSIVLVGLMIFIAIFFWSAKVFFYMSKPPANAVEINVVGKQWMWKIQHADGRREINELHLPIGRTVEILRKHKALGR